MKGDGKAAEYGDGMSSYFLEIDDQTLYKAIEEVVRGLSHLNGLHLSEADRCDLVQDEFLRLRENDSRLLRYFHGRSSFATWLSRVLRNRATTHHRQMKRWEPLEESSFDDCRSEPEQEARLLMDERRELLLWVKSRVTESQQVVLDQCAQDDFDATTLARELGISADLVYGRKRDAIRRARNLLRDYEKGIVSSRKK